MARPQLLCFAFHQVLGNVIPMLVLAVVFSFSCESWMRTAAQMIMVFLYYLTFSYVLWSSIEEVYFESQKRILYHWMCPVIAHTSIASIYWIAKEDGTFLHRFTHTYIYIYICSPPPMNYLLCFLLLRKYRFKWWHVPWRCSPILKRDFLLREESLILKRDLF